MSDQQSLHKSVDDSTVDETGVVEDKPDGNIVSRGSGLKQPVTGESFELDQKKKSFQITSIELDHGVAQPDKGYGDDLHQSAENVAVFEQNSSSRIDRTSSNVQPKKKISFQVTSIESTKGRSRGDSNGYDDIDELNESEFVEEDEGSVDSTLSHASGNGNGTSRFKVVKIPRYDSKPYNRGKWMCWDFTNTKFPPPSAEHLLIALPGHNSDALSDKSDQDSVISGRNSVVNNSVGASSGPVSKYSGGNSEHLGHEGSVQPNIGREASLHEEKNYVIKSDFTGNPSSPRIDKPVVDSVINNSSGLGKTENPTCQSTGGLVDETTLSLQDLSEDEVVAERIKKAMNQVVQIKADLLQDVNADVKKLKQTIQQLTSENHRLKEENELLRQQLSNQSKTESI